MLWADSSPLSPPAPDPSGPFRFTLPAVPRRSHQGPPHCVTVTSTSSERRTMQEDHDHPCPSRDLRPLRKPPYNLPFRDRPRRLAACDSLDWRTYSTPTSPKRPTTRDLDRLTRRALVVGLLACVGVGIWSTPRGTDSAVPRTDAVSMPTPPSSTAGRTAMLTSPSPSPSVPRALPSATPRTSKDATPAAEKRRRRIIRPAPRRLPENIRRPLPKTTTATVAGARKAESKKLEGRTSEPSVPLIATKCEELFPPSRPDFRVRNLACRELLG